MTRQRFDRGLSLVELMVAITIGLILLLGLANLLISTSHHYKTQDDFSRIQDSGAYVLNTLGYDIRHAGFYGDVALNTPDGVGTQLSSLGITPVANDCGGVGLGRSVVVVPGTDNNPYRFYVYGLPSPTEAATAVSFAGCVDPANFLPGSPFLLLRGGVGSPISMNPVPAAVSGDANLYVQGNPAKAFVYQGTSIAGTSVAGQSMPTVGVASAPRIASAFRYFYHLYYLRPCSQPDGPVSAVGPSDATCTGASDGGRPIPTLVRKTVTANAAGGLVTQEEAIAEGVERMAFVYGVDDLPAGAPDGTVDVYTAFPTNIQLSSVITINVWLLMRSSKPDFTYDDTTKTYLDNNGVAFTCTVSATPNACRYHRHVFNQTFQVRNAYITH